MKKYQRQSKILELIENFEIETQEDLSNYLKRAGIDITQATISRDIKELRLVKVLSKNGKYKYALMEDNKEGTTERLIKIFKSSVIDFNVAENIIIIKTLPGAAQVCASAIDTAKIDGIAGSIAGNDTIFVAIEKEEKTDYVLKILTSFLN
ncbi:MULTISPECIES: arginine repressor [Tissierellales]|jgi:transcriptional regulator of arginine metabolism|uniref:Arginine repressor n=1 Tax=Acidilutibacter cellobiosedens TaxID=2507161 RepID=A0A410QD62_9FIRM|nr:MULTISPECIES: arginine repressor [Tissierellales]MBE6082603.1 arginine repressor [Tissierellaceae bacterium]QAT61758.1 arginine repressor [Acidilutibacter cellobiosedens]SCL82370.1 Arginine hydroxamate resistance protein [Sporanaerobacter sp. PP17-6a]